MVWWLWIAIRVALLIGIEVLAGSMEYIVKAVEMERKLKRKLKNFCNGIEFFTAVGIIIEVYLLLVGF